MNERLISIPLTTPLQAAADAQATVELPFGATLVGISASLDAVSGSPTAITVDVNDDGAGITGFTAVSVGTTAGAAVTVKSKHFGGTVDPVAIAAGSEVDIDINVTGGTSPTARVTVTLFLLVGEA